jgi:hypothetical protein
MEQLSIEVEWLMQELQAELKALPAKNPNRPRE